jgi:hypothetical protein
MAEKDVVTATSPDGAKVRVTRKAYDTLYAPAGWTAAAPKARKDTKAADEAADTTEADEA